nr:hypothetical protein [Volvox reticuliferus]
MASMPIEDFDVEAAFEAELMRVKAGVPGFSQDDRGWWSDTDASDEDDTEPTSLHILRTALERRERAAEEFGLEWQRFCLEVEVNEPATQPSVPRVIPVSSGTTAMGSPSTVFSNEAGSGQGASDLVCELQRERHATAGIAIVAAGEMLLPSDYPLVQPADGLVGVELEHKPDAVESSAIDLDGRASLVATQFQRTQAIGLPTDAETATMDDQIQRDGCDQYDQRHRMLAELDEQLAAAAAEQQAEISAAALEQSLLDAEIDANIRRLEMARKQIAEREALQDAALAALRQEVLSLARQHMAAWCIARAWRRYRQGPVRAMRLAAAVRIQAAWRGYVDRRNARQLRTRCALLQAIEDAVKNKQLERLHSVMCRARDSGFDDIIQTQLAALEAATTSAAANLRAVTANGNYLEYRVALMAAESFPNLAQLVEESISVFEGRQADAEATMWTAVIDTPIRSFYCILESARTMGIEADQLNNALEAVRQRDAQLREKLAAASRAPGATFSTTEFEALASRAMRLGLKGEAAAARLVVERRRRFLALALRTRASIPPYYAADCFSLLQEAQCMGMAVEAEELAQQLQDRQRHLQAAVREVAREGTAANFIATIKHAVDLRLPAALLQDSQAFFLDRRAVRYRAVACAATCGSQREYLAARGAGVQAGMDLTKLVDADNKLASRRRIMLSSLMQATANICGGALPLKNSTQMKELHTHAARYIAALAVLGRAADRPTDAIKSMAEYAQTPNERAMQQQGLSNPVVNPVWCLSEFCLTSIEMGFEGICLHLQRLYLERAKRDEISQLSIPGELHDRQQTCYAFAEALQPLQSTVELGLCDAVCLALCALALHLSVHLAKGSNGLLGALVENDYWGLPLLLASSALEVRAVECTYTRIWAGTIYRSGSDGNDDDLASRMALLLRQRNMRSVQPWVPSSPLLVFPTLPQDTISGSVHPNILVPASNCADGAFASHSMLLPSSNEGGIKSLTEVIILRNVPGAASGCPAAATAYMPLLFRLDIRLECLTSLEGLDLLCPSLRLLSVDANLVSSLDGLKGLSGLQELSLKQNHLTTLVCRAQAGEVVWDLPSGTRLLRLNLDSNRLSGQLLGLNGCSGLRSLSLADNVLTDIGSELDSCKASLTFLSLRSNHLTSLRAQLAPLTSLRELDVSGNYLTSLEGLQGLLMLQSLSARGNAIATLPTPLCLPYLTELDLGHNVLTAFGNMGNSFAGSNLILPLLRRLVLQENSIRFLGPLGPMIHLTSLDLSFNKIASLEMLRVLVHLSGLRSLNISNNPITEWGGQGIGHIGRRLLETRLIIGQRLSPITISESMVWALPSLQELHYDDVTQHYRLHSVIRASVVSPSCTTNGTRQIRMAGSYYAVNRSCVSMFVASALCCQTHVIGQSRRQPMSGRTPRRPHVLCGGLLGVPMDPAAVWRTLVGAFSSSIGVNTACGLETAFNCSGPSRVVQAPPCMISSRLDFDAHDSVVTPKISGIVQPELGSAAIGWLARLHRLWHAALPTEAAHSHVRQLKAVRCLDLQGCGASVATLHVTPVLQLPLSSDAAPSTSLVLSPEDRRADMLDFPAMRHLRPSGRSFQFRSAVGMLSTLHVLDERNDSVEKLVGQASEACALAIGLEMHKRYEVSASQTERQLMEELHNLFKQRCGEVVGGPCSVLASGRRLTSRPSYFLFRMCQHSRAVTTIIQASWREMYARKEIPVDMETRKAEALQCAAACIIQAWWRRHCIRKAGIQSSWQHMKKQQQESQRQEAAAITIQAHFRGYLVRKRLCRALAAVQLPLGLNKDAGLLLGSDDFDDMLQEVLLPIERILQDDSTHPSRTCSVHHNANIIPAGSNCGFHPHRQLNPTSRLNVPGCDGGDALRQEWPALMALSLSSAGIQKELQIGERGAREIVHQGVNRMGLQLHDPSPSTTHVESLPYADSALLTSISDQHRDSGSGTGPALNQHTGFGQTLPPKSPVAFPLLSVLPPISSRVSTLQTSYPSSLPVLHDNNSSAMQLSPESLQEVFSRSSGPDDREQRHLQRLQKLMAEWGFTDLGTAEAYYRRAVRQKQGHGRRKLEDKCQNSSQRSLMLRKVEARREAVAAGANRFGMQPNRVSKPGGTASKDAAVPPGSIQQKPSNGLLNGDGIAGCDVLPRLNQTIGQSGGKGIPSADTVSPASSNRHMLAPLGAACTWKLSPKSGRIHRPYHLPTLANNNWIAPFEDELAMRSTSEGRSPFREGHADSSGGFATRSLLPERPATVQSVDSSPEVLML